MRTLAQIAAMVTEHAATADIPNTKPNYKNQNF